MVVHILALATKCSVQRLTFRPVSQGMHCTLVTTGHMSIIMPLSAIYSTICVPLADIKMALSFILRVLKHFSRPHTF